MKTFGLYRGWLALVITVSLWGFVVYGFARVEEQKISYVNSVYSAEKATQVKAQASRVHGLLNDTKDGRTILQGIIAADVIALVDALDEIGKIVGVSVKINNVTPEAQKKGAPILAAIPVTLSVQTDGSYTQIYRLVELLNTQPIPTTILQLDITRTGSVWHLAARLRVLTAAELSS